MRFDEYQDSAITFVEFPTKLWRHYLLVGIFNEVGEVAGVWKKELRGDFNGQPDALRAKMAGEIVDVFWYIAVFEDYLCTSLEEFLYYWSPNDFVQAQMPASEHAIIFANLAYDTGHLLQSLKCDYTDEYAREKLRSIAGRLAALCGIYAINLEQALSDNIKKLAERLTTAGTIKSNAGARDLDLDVVLCPGCERVWTLEDIEHMHEERGCYVCACGWEDETEPFYRPLTVREYLSGRYYWDILKKAWVEIEKQT